MEKYTCRHCGEEFSPSKEEIELFENSYTREPDECPKCFDINTNSREEIYDFSDADPGL